VTNGAAAEVPPQHYDSGVFVLCSMFSNMIVQADLKLIAAACIDKVQWAYLLVVRIA
jgi:hypothetical protein